MRIYVLKLRIGFNIVVNLKTLSSEYWLVVKGGIDKAVEELGLTIDTQGPAAETEIAEQVAQLENQLSQNPDAIIIAPLDQDAVIGAITGANYEGIVIFCDTDCGYEAKTAFVGTSNELSALKPMMLTPVTPAASMAFRAPMAVSSFMYSTRLMSGLAYA